MRFKPMSNGKWNGMELYKYAICGIPQMMHLTLKAIFWDYKRPTQRCQISEEKVKSINESINELAEEVQDVKPGKVQELDYVKQTNVEAKTASVIQKVLDVLPRAAETTATFTPLAPFSKLIGKGVQGIVDAIAKRKKSLE